MVIARLIADPDDWETRIEAMREVLRHSEVLSADIAARLIDAEDGVGEIEFDGDDPQLAFNAVETQFGQCDVLVSASPIAVPRVFVSDMDSTMIGQECIDELADYAGLKPQIAEITERAMQGELDFEDALRERVALLKGLGEDAITQCLEERIRPTPGARTLTKTLRAHGARTVLVTGGFHHFADVVGQDLGFERVVGNRLAVADGKLTGELAGPITDAGTKAAVLAEESERAGEGARSLSTGDGANDIPMIQASDYGFAYRAKPKARAAANGRIDSEDHTAVLLLLGIARSDWVEG